MEWTKFTVINILLVLIYIIITLTLFNSSDPGFIYDFKEQVKFNEVLTTNDNNLIVVGSIAGDSYEQGMDAYVAKIDSSGSIIWSHSFGGVGDDKFHNLALTKDGFILVGEDAEAMDLSTDAYVVKIDFNGDQKWEKKFNNRFNSQFYDLKVDESGNLVLAGELEYIDAETNNLTTNAYIVKTDSLAQQLWSREFGGVNFTSAQTVAKADNSYYIAGFTNSEQGQQAWLIKVDSKGKQQWEKEYFNDGSSSFYDLEKLSTGGLIAVGEANDQSNCGYLVRINNQGEQVWDRLIEEGKRSYSVFYTVTELAADQIVVGGLVSVPDKFGNVSSIRYKNLIYSVEVNGEGEVIGNNKFSAEKLGSIIGSARMRDQQIVLVGNLNQYEVDYKGYLAILKD